MPRPPRVPPPPSSTAAVYDRHAPDYDRWSRRRRKVARFRIIERPILEATAGAERVLEVGSGTGRLLRQVVSPTRVGIDISRSMLRRARGVSCLAADAHDLPFAEGTFDAIIAGDAVFRYLDYDRAFSECARVLAPGGKLAFHQYALRTWTLSRSSCFPLHLRDAAELDPFATRYGLVRTKAHYFRAIRIPPYAVPIPSWVSLPLWSDCVVSFERN